MRSADDVAAIHLLVAGLPACGFSRAFPRDWPTGHRWAARQEFAELLSEGREELCPGCREGGPDVQEQGCAECELPLPKRGGYARMGESERCARCYRERWGKWVPLEREA